MITNAFMSYEHATDAEVDPDWAVKVMEGLAATLGQLSTEGRSEFTADLEALASELPDDPFYDGWRDFYREFPSVLGWDWLADGGQRFQRLPAPDGGRRERPDPARQSCASAATSCRTNVANPSSPRAPPIHASRCSRATASAWSRSSTVGASRTAQSTTDPVQLSW